MESCAKRKEEKKKYFFFILFSLVQFSKWEIVRIGPSNALSDGVHVQNNLDFQVAMRGSGASASAGHHRHRRERDDRDDCRVSIICPNDRWVVESNPLRLLSVQSAIQGTKYRKYSTMMMMQ